VIWAVQNGHLDDVPVERIKACQAAWTDFLVTRRPELIGGIAAQKTLGPELTSALQAAVGQFKATWK
jgi:F-type H+-transporting ATPase subunit alpha